MNILLYIISALFGYLLGSIPWALVIGKVFYHTDVRNYGSGNLGATNAGRLFGTKIFVLVAVLDAAKGLIVYLIVNHFDHNAALFASLFVAIGHCYPVFANFKGGKAVATTFGIVLGIATTSMNSFLIQFLLPLAIFLLIALTTKYVSLGSLISLLSAAILTLIHSPIKLDGIVVTILFLLMAYRHRANIQRLLKGEETKTSFKKKIS